MNIVTGYRGEAHITSQQDQAKNQGIFGSGSYVLDVGQKLRAEAVSANEVRIYDGVLSHQGVVAVVEKNTYDSVTITSGSQGADRCDLIVARYTKEGSTGVESMTFEVIMGTEGETTPPAYNEGDIQAGDSPVDMPIYEVHLSGVQIESLVPVASQIGNVNGAFTMNDILPSGDVNAATTPGAYELVSTNTYTNLPTGITSGVLTVSKAREGGFITQLLTSGDFVYTRTLSSAWSEWRTIYAPTMIVSKTMDLTFSSYYARVLRSNFPGVDNMNNYAWIVSSTKYDHLFKAQTGTSADVLSVRCYKLSGSSNATLSLANEETITNVQIVGIRFVD